MAAKTKAISFEESVKRLDEILAVLENGQGDLESSIKLFSEGAELLGICKKRLDEAEMKVEKILPKMNDTEEE